MCHVTGYIYIREFIHFIDSINQHVIAINNYLFGWFLEQYCRVKRVTNSLTCLVIQ